jgi:uncharacterized protein YozE (UPF0346 family)
MKSFKKFLNEGYNNPIHREYIEEIVEKSIPKTNENYEAVVDFLHKAKNFGSKTSETLSDNTGISIGAAFRITKAVAEHLKANFGTPNKTQTQSQRVHNYLKQKSIGPRK